MVARPLNSLWHHIRYIPLLSALTFSRGRAFDRRSRALGAQSWDSYYAIFRPLGDGLTVSY